jgi:hypothetical protein
VARRGASDAPLLTTRALNRTLLGRQRLLERVPAAPLDLVEHLVGLQAQEPGDPYVGLWSRIEGFDPEVSSRAVAERRAVRIGLMRTTLHLVTRRDALGLAPVMGDLQRRTFRSTPFARDLAGIDPEEVLAVAAAALAAAPRTPTELGAILGARWPDAKPAALAYLARYHLHLVQVPPRGLWRQTARSANTTLEAWTGERPVAFATPDLVRRYLAAFGPATVADMRTWSWLTGLREVVEGMRGGLRTFQDERGRELFDVPDGLLVDPETPAPVRFLPQYDNVFLSHDDRSRISGAMTWGVEFGWKGPILVDGGITGGWRVRRERGLATMTVEIGRGLTPDERQDLEAEAERLGAFLDPDLRRALVVVAAG